MKGPIVDDQQDAWRLSWISTNAPAAQYGGAAPLLLQLIGERSYGALVVAVPASEVAPQQRVYGSGIDGLAEYFVPTSQVDYARAARLFPEMTVYPCTFIDGTVYEVAVRDAKMGKVVVPNHGGSHKGLGE
jgi:hypothetical protein